MKIPDLFYSECKHPKQSLWLVMRGMTLEIKGKAKRKKVTFSSTHVLMSHSFGWPSKNKHKQVPLNHYY